jgi:hypothetical protein
MKKGSLALVCIMFAGAALVTLASTCLGWRDGNATPRRQSAGCRSSPTSRLLQADAGGATGLEQRAQRSDARQQRRCGGPADAFFRTSRGRRHRT